MKKMVMIAVIATVCFTGISLIAGTTDDKTVKTEKKTENVVSENEKDNSGPENLPLFKANVKAVRCNRDGSSNGDIFIDVYCATEQCNSYKAMASGKLYPVYVNNTGAWCGRYYIIVTDPLDSYRFYFNL